LGVKSKNIYMGGKNSRYRRGKKLYIEGEKILGNENFELGSNKSNFRGGKNVYKGGKNRKTRSLGAVFPLICDGRIVLAVGSGLAKFGLRFQMRRAIPGHQGL